MAGTPNEYANTLGSPASFTYTTQDLFPPAMRPVYSGSPLGVPAPDRMPANSVPSPQGDNATAYAQGKVGQPAHSQPIFWSLVLVVVGVVLLSHVAQLSLRGLG